MPKLEEHIALRFTGRTLDTHAMDVRLLAPSLLAFADMLKTTQEIALPEAHQPTIEIKATGEGSFIIELASTTSILDTLISALNSDTTQAVLSASGLGGIAVGAIQLIIHLAKHGRNPRREPLQDGTVKLTWGETTLIIPSQSVRVASNCTYRQHAQKFIHPVTCDGVDTVEIQTGTTPPFTVEKSDAPVFSFDLDTEEVQSESTRRLTLQIIQLTLHGEYRWRFSDGGSTFSAVMADEDFKERIAGRTVRFAEGDQLEVQMRERQVKRVDGSLKISREIVSVFRHIPAPEQTMLLFDDGEN